MQQQGLPRMDPGRGQFAGRSLRLRKKQALRQRRKRQVRRAREARRELQLAATSADIIKHNEAR